MEIEVEDGNYLLVRQEVGVSIVGVIMQELALWHESCYNISIGLMSRITSECGLVTHLMASYFFTLRQTDTQRNSHSPHFNAETQSHPFLMGSSSA